MIGDLSLSRGTSRSQYVVYWGTDGDETGDHLQPSSKLFGCQERNIYSSWFGGRLPTPTILETIYWKLYGMWVVSQWTVLGKIKNIEWELM